MNDSNVNEGAIVKPHGGRHVDLVLLGDERAEAFEKTSSLQKLQISLFRGESPPPEFTRPEVAKILIEGYSRGSGK